MGDKRYRVGGTRGGHDQFKWSDVATDEHRENYLGHSLLAPVGRWQKGEKGQNISGQYLKDRPVKYD